MSTTPTSGEWSLPYGGTMRVDVREFEADLTIYLARADAGEEFVLTHDDEPLVRILPCSPMSDVERGIAEGWIESPRRMDLGRVERAPSTESTQNVLDADRG